MAAHRLLAALLAAPLLARASPCLSSYNPTSCSSCLTHSSCFWCGNGVPANYWPGACYAAGTSCGPYKTTQSYYCANGNSHDDYDTNDDIATATEAAEAQEAGGITGSVIMSFVVAGLTSRWLIIDAGPGAAGCDGAPWVPRATKQLPILLVAIFLQTFGIITGIAAMATPWWVGYSYYSYYYSSPTLIHTVMDPQNASIIGGSLYLIALLGFVFPAWICAVASVRRVQRVVRFRALTPVTCMCGLPVVMGLTWFGFVIQGIGAIFILIFTPLYYGNKRSYADTIGPGGGLFLFAFVASLVANILYSVSSCCGMGHLPGVGRSRTRCCCTNKDLLTPVAGSVLATSAPMWALEVPPTWTSAGPPPGWAPRGPSQAQLQWGPAQAQQQWSSAQAQRSFALQPQHDCSERAGLHYRGGFRLLIL